jgi:hypothetical protein
MSTYAGKTLAEMAVSALADPAGVKAELEARVARGGKSAKNAEKALERMASGASVAFPPKAPKPVTAPASAPTTGSNPNLPQVADAAKAVATGPKATEKALWAYAAKALKASGYPVPRHIAKAARIGNLTPKVSA